MVSSGSSIFVFSTIWIGREAICMNGFRGYKEIYCYSKCSRFDKTENMKKKKWVGNKKKKRYFGMHYNHENGSISLFKKRLNTQFLFWWVIRIRFQLYLKFRFNWRLAKTKRMKVENDREKGGGVEARKCEYIWYTYYFDLYFFPIVYFSLAEFESFRPVYIKQQQVYTWRNEDNDE